MPRSRDRHERGIRGPLALPNRWTRSPVPLHSPGRTEFFNECVTSAMSQIASFNPQALHDVVVGVEEVPHFNVDWSSGRVPMSAALEPGRGRSPRIVIYERPHELRVASRSQLRQLVHRTIVEQVSTLMGIPIEELTDRDWQGG